MAVKIKDKEKPLRWVGSSYEDLWGFPRPVMREVGYALDAAQTGGKHKDAKVLQGFGGAGVLEVVSYHDGDTYRAVYTVKLKDAVYVLHCFQKKSLRGRRTSKTDSDLIKQRLKAARANYKKSTEEKK